MVCTDTLEIVAACSTASDSSQPLSSPSGITSEGEAVGAGGRFNLAAAFFCLRVRCRFRPEASVVAVTEHTPRPVSSCAGQGNGKSVIGSTLYDLKSLGDDDGCAVNEDRAASA